MIISDEDVDKFETRGLTIIEYLHDDLLLQVDIE